MSAGSYFLIGLQWFIAVFGFVTGAFVVFVGIILIVSLINGAINKAKRNDDD